MMSEGLFVKTKAQQTKAEGMRAAHGSVVQKEGTA